jgi:hypothetical protein
MVYYKLNRPIWNLPANNVQKNRGIEVRFQVRARDFALLESVQPLAQLVPGALFVVTERPELEAVHSPTSNKVMNKITYKLYLYSPICLHDQHRNNSDCTFTCRIQNKTLSRLSSGKVTLPGTDKPAFKHDSTPYVRFIWKRTFSEIYNVVS